MHNAMMNVWACASTSSHYGPASPDLSHFYNIQVPAKVFTRSV